MNKTRAWLCCRAASYKVPLGGTSESKLTNAVDGGISQEWSFVTSEWAAEARSNFERIYRCNNVACRVSASCEKPLPELGQRFTSSELTVFRDILKHSEIVVILHT